MPVPWEVSSAALTGHCCPGMLRPSQPELIRCASPTLVIAPWQSLIPFGEWFAHRKCTALL